MGGLAHAASELLERWGAKDLGDVLLKGAQSGEYSLKKQGPASGLLAGLMKHFESTWQTDAGKIVQPLLPEMHYVASDPVRHAEYYRQRTTKQLASDQRVARLASTVENIENALWWKHKNAGYKVAPQVKGAYFPDKYPREMFEPGTKEHEAAIQEIMRVRGKTRAAATKTLDSFNPNKFENPLNAPYHHLESRRTLHLPQLARKDVAVDLEYITGAIRRFHEKNIFGEDASKATMLLEQVRKESGNQGYNFAAGAYSTYMGYNHNAYIGKAERAVQSYEIASHLGLAVFAHPGKTLESLIVGGIRPFLKGVGDLLDDKEEFYNFGVRSAASLNDATHELRRAVNAENESLGSKILRATQFQKVIGFQEALHSNVGKHTALDMFERLQQSGGKDKEALMMLQQLHVDVANALQRGSLDNDDLLRAGYRMSKIVLGGRTALDLPLYWRNHWSMRLLTMFKPFFFSQSKLIKDQIIKPALRGNVKPLLYAAVIYPLLGEVVTDLKYFVRGKGQDERPDLDRFPYDRALENLSQVGAFGMASDVMNAITTSTPSTTYQFLTGPVIADAVDTVEMIKGDWDTKERFFLRRIPTIGPALSRYLVPAKRRKKGFFEQGKVTKFVERSTERVKDLMQ